MPGTVLIKSTLCQIHSHVVDLPAAGPEPAGLLGQAGLRGAPALRHGSRRRHLAYRNVPAFTRARAMARGLRATVAASEGRALRREPEPAEALLPVPGGAQAVATGHPRPLPGFARSGGVLPEEE